MDLNHFQTWLRSHGAAERTIDARVKLARNRTRTWDLARVGEPEIRGWLHSPGFSRWTRATYYGNLSSLFTWMVESGQRLDNPMTGIDRPRSPTPTPRPLSGEQVDRVLDAATGNVRTWVLLGMLAGLRAHEIAKIRGEDVTRDGIYVDGKGGQSAVIPTHPALWEVAQSYPATGWWFPSPLRDGPLRPNTVTIAVSRLFDGLGIEGSIHRCRHTYGTRLLRGGANIRVVQTLMRHASLATTALYCAVDEDERRAAVARLVAA